MEGRKANQEYHRSQENIDMEDKKGGLSEEFFDFASLDALGLPAANASFYKDYPTNEAEMTDGYLPSSIPSVIEDSNGNRVVDDEEWKSHLSKSSGGTISGGLAFGVPTGKAYEGSALPTKSNEAIKQLSTGRYDGNVVLVRGGLCILCGVLFIHMYGSVVLVRGVHILFLCWVLGVDGWGCTCMADTG